MCVVIEKVKNLDKEEKDVVKANLKKAKLDRQEVWWEDISDWTAYKEKFALIIASPPFVKVLFFFCYSDLFLHTKRVTNFSYI